MKFGGLQNLTKELLTTLKDESLNKERKTLALELLDFIDEASSLDYTFPNDEYFPEGEGIDPTVVRAIKVFVRAGDKWNATRPPYPWEVKATVVRSGGSIPESLIPSETKSGDFEFED